jgi:23S rRNA pseudouridine1911/1915/1917 synthase
VRAGSTLDVGIAAVLHAAPPRYPLHIVYESESAIALVKPPGQHVQGTPIGDAGTVEAAVRDHLRSARGGATRQRTYVGIVHRLDAPASGLMVVATSPEAAGPLSDQFRHRTAERQYLALVQGVPPAVSGEIDLPLERRRQGRVHAARPGEGKPARTHYELVARYVTPPWSLLALQLDTGRQHQIRVHLAETVGPIVGDGLYGASFAKTRLRLHARALAFTDPGTGQRVRLSAEPDEGFYSEG